MCKVFIVTGAPGSGKTVAQQEFINLNSNYLAFDIDWLTESASLLANKSVIFEKSTWKPYRGLWFEVLHSVIKNNKTPVLFAAINKNDIHEQRLPDWCDSVEWLLLDCSDDIRKKRLANRYNWSDEMIEEALEDAKVLKESIIDTVDTGINNPTEVAKQILSWLDKTKSIN